MVDDAHVASPIYVVWSKTNKEFLSTVIFLMIYEIVYGMTAGDGEAVYRKKNKTGVFSIPIKKCE